MSLDKFLHVLSTGGMSLLEVQDSPTHDPVNHPSHYTSSEARCLRCGHPIECIDVVEHMDFSVGNAVKYLWRFDLKNGVEDLKKAAWYVNREIQKRERTK